MVHLLTTGWRQKSQQYKHVHFISSQHPSSTFRDTVFRLDSGTTLHHHPMLRATLHHHPTRRATLHHHRTPRATVHHQTTHRTTLHHHQTPRATLHHHGAQSTLHHHRRPELLSTITDAQSYSPPSQTPRATLHNHSHPADRLCMTNRAVIGTQIKFASIVRWLGSRTSEI